MVLGWSSPAQLPVMDGEVFNFTVTAAHFQWVSSIPTLGAACACMPAGFLVDLIGRKYTMLAMAIPFVVGKYLVIRHPMGYANISVWQVGVSSFGRRLSRC
jgi:MFS family permease